jgi:hypothetical protein
MVTSQQKETTNMALPILPCWRGQYEPEDYSMEVNEGVTLKTQVPLLQAEVLTANEIRTINNPEPLTSTKEDI